MPRRTQPDPLAAKFGARIVQLYKEQGLTLKQLAAKSRMGESHLSNITRGLAMPTVATLRRIACGLEVPLARLAAFPGESERDDFVDMVYRIPDEALPKLAERINRVLEKETAETTADHDANDRKPDGGDDAL